MKRIGLDRSLRRIWKLLNEHQQNILMNEHACLERSLLLHSTSPWSCPSVVQGSQQVLGGVKVMPPAFLLRASSICLQRQQVGQGDENDGDPHGTSRLGSSSVEAPLQQLSARVSERWVFGALCCLSHHLAPSQGPSGSSGWGRLSEPLQTQESRKNDSVRYILGL